MMHEDQFPWSADASRASILSGKAVSTFFQPIVYLGRKSLFGVEALSRGVGGEAGDSIPHPFLHRHVQRAGTSVNKSEIIQFDRLCQRKAMEAFAPMHALSHDLYLGLNIDAFLLNQELIDHMHLLGMAQRLGIDPANIVLEIDATSAPDLSVLADYASVRRGSGFQICLDRMGTDTACMERIAELKPEIVKIDRALVSGMRATGHIRELVRGLVSTAARIGTLPVAVGVETKEDVILLLELGVEVFQGYYFARPYPGGAKLPDVSTAMEAVAAHYRDHVLRKISASKEQHRIYNLVIDQALETLPYTTLPELDAALIAMLALHPSLHCAYVLNESGLQISSAVCTPRLARRERKTLQQPSRKGADHSIKEYFLSIKAGLPRYTTEPGISQLTGLPCRTICASFTDVMDRARILCLEIGLSE